MEKLISFQARLLSRVSDRFFRFLYHQLPWHQRFLAIKGPRGTGKTTMLLQYAKYELKDPAKHLYLTMDHPYFYDHKLTNLADDFYNLGGKTLLLDEIHKYSNWSSELKYLYDAYPDLQVIFTSSSALDLYRGEADLSRRIISYELPGLSFREYLNLEHGFSFERHSLEGILNNHLVISTEINEQIKPLALIKAYWQHGYFPFFIERQEEVYQQQLYQAIETTLFQDISFIEGFSVSNVRKMQSLLGVLAETAPFEPNISKLAERLHLSRDYVKQYLFLLSKGRIINLLSKKSKGLPSLQKPDKIYLENPNYSFALKDQPNIGNLRETFFLNQMRNAGHELFFAGKKVDFETINGLRFEIGGKNKTRPAEEGLYLIKDGIPDGFNKTIPLWLFGFLY